MTGAELVGDGDVVAVVDDDGAVGIDFDEQLGVRVVDAVVEFSEDALAALAAVDDVVVDLL